MTKQKQSERDEAIATLRETLKPGDTVTCVLRHVSRSGMSRLIDFYLIRDSETSRLTWSIARALDMTYDRNREALRVGGCGMDMGFHVVYNLSRVLFKDDFQCIGENCPANDHTNAYYANTREHRCIICGKDCPMEPKTYGTHPDGTKRTEDFKYTREIGRRKYGVCSPDCVTKVWMHSDAGYALKSRWL